MTTSTSMNTRIVKSPLIKSQLLLIKAKSLHYSASFCSKWSYSSLSFYLGSNTWINKYLCAIFAIKICLKIFSLVVGLKRLVDAGVVIISLAAMKSIGVGRLVNTLCFIIVLKWLFLKNTDSSPSLAVVLSSHRPWYDSWVAVDSRNCSAIKPFNKQRLKLTISH